MNYLVGTLKNKSYIIALLFITFTGNLDAKIEKIPPTYKAEKERVFLSVEKISPNKSKRSALDNKKIFRKYIPLKLIVINSSNNVIELNRNSTNLNLIKPKKVARMFYKPFWKALALFNTATAGILYFATGELFLLISGGLNSFVLLLYQMSDNYITNLFIKCSTDLKESLFIAPGSTVEKIIYVPKKEYSPQFNLKMFKSPGNRYIDFNINLLMFGE